jgi:hypothetical protein
LQASYRVDHLLAKESKPFSNGRFIRKCLQHIVQEIYPEKETVFNTVSLSRATMMRGVDDTSSDLLHELRNKEKEFERFYLALDL